MFPLISPPGGIECNSGHFWGLVCPQVVKLKQYLTVHEQLCGLVKLSMLCEHSPTQYIPSFRLVQTKVFGFRTLARESHMCVIMCFCMCAPICCRFQIFNIVAEFWVYAIVLVFSCSVCMLPIVSPGSILSWYQAVRLCMNLVLECVLKCFFVGGRVLPELQQFVVCNLDPVLIREAMYFLCGWPLGVFRNTHLPHFRLCVSDWCSPEWEDLIRYYSCHCVCTVKLENLSIITRQ